MPKRRGTPACRPGKLSMTGHGGAVDPPNDFTTVNKLRGQMSAAGTLGALNLITRSARDLPGRKAIVLVSDGFVLPSPMDDPRVREALDLAIDQAARTGVVIYALDARGLQTGGLVAEDNISRGGESLVRNDHAERKSTLLKTQDALGYLAEQTGGFAVLKDVSKTWVYRLANYRNTLGHVIPERIITRPPSAELKPGQVDQDSLPPYDVLDAIMACYVEKNMNIAKIVAEGYAEADVLRVVKLIRINEYKRRQSPVGVRITGRSFGKDWRYPITVRYQDEF